MAALVQDERIYETSVTTGTGEYTLAGAVTGFQPASVVGNGNYLIGFVTDDTNWEAGIYTYASGPDRLQRTHIVASSNGDAAVDWGSGTKKLRCGMIAFFGQPRQVSKSVAGSADVTLTALEQRCNQLILTGILTGNINVIVDTTKWRWEVYNNTSGSYTVTVKTSAGTGVLVPQGKRTVLSCDGTNVVAPVDALPALAVAGALSAGGAFTQSVGANVSSASTINLTNVVGNSCHVTGTTTITAVTLAAGKCVEVIFDDALTLTHHGTNNNLPNGGSNITTAAGDRALYWSDGTTVYCVRYSRASGRPLQIPGASQAQQESGSATDVAVTPGVQQYHPSACKSWIEYDGTAGPAILASYNMDALTHHGAGDNTCNFTTDFSSANYGFAACGSSVTTDGRYIWNSGAAPAAGSFRHVTANGSATPTDSDFASLVFFGDQS